MGAGSRLTRVGLNPERIAWCIAGAVLGERLPPGLVLAHRRAPEYAVRAGAPAAPRRERDHRARDGQGPGRRAHRCTGSQHAPHTRRRPGSCPCRPHSSLPAMQGSLMPCQRAPVAGSAASARSQRRPADAWPLSPQIWATVAVLAAPGPCLARTLMAWCTCVYAPRPGAAAQLWCVRSASGRRAKLLRPWPLLRAVRVRWRRG